MKIATRFACCAAALAVAIAGCTLHGADSQATPALATALGPTGGQEGKPAREAKPDDAIEDHFPIPVQKPTPEEVTQALVKLRNFIDKKYPAVVIDNSTKQPINDLSKPNADARLTLGGYPFGVIHAGMISAADATGDKAFADFTARRLNLIGGNNYNFWKQQHAQIGNKSSVRNLFVPNSLDSCGAWGAALVKARLANIGADTTPIIETWADYVHTKQFRLSDGTLARKSPPPESIWGDDMYMSMPLLSQMYKMTGKTEYLDDAVKQSLQISARLFKPAKGIYAHGWLSNNPDDQIEIYWGRVNGWCVMANCELLDVMPENHPKREEVLKIVRAHLKAIVHLQSPVGLWHQLLDRDDAYLETSASAMYTYALAHAVNKGWIDSTYAGSAIMGWCGVATRQNAEGGFDGTCVGTNIAYDNLYYYHRPATDDVHGYGPVLLAGSEIIRLVKNDKLNIAYGRGGYYNVTPKKSGASKPAE